MACFYSIVVTHRNLNFPLFFHCFTRALRDKGPTSEPRFFHCFSIPSISIILLFFYLASFSSHSRAAIFPLFFHCFTPLLHHSPSIFPLFFHRFSIANGLTSKPPFFHCFSIVLLEGSIVCTLGKEMLLVTNLDTVQSSYSYFSID